jgi:hypothetical protein
MAAKKTVAKPARLSASRKPAQKSAVESKTRKAPTAGDETVTIDRRRIGRRDEAVAAAPAAPIAAGPALERRKKVQRRRQIDPTTCERDYSVEEVEFMNAMDDYKRTSGRMFPTCSEVLEVIRGLGYVKLSPAGQAMMSENRDLTSADELLAEAEGLLNDVAL